MLLLWVTSYYVHVIKIKNYTIDDIFEKGIELKRSNGVEEGIKMFILDNIEENIPKDRTIEKLQRRFNITEEQAL